MTMTSKGKLIYTSLQQQGRVPSPNVKGGKAPEGKALEELLKQAPTPREGVQFAYNVSPQHHYDPIGMTMGAQHRFLTGVYNQQHTVMVKVAGIYLYTETWPK